MEHIKGMKSGQRETFIPSKPEGFLVLKRNCPVVILPNTFNEEKAMKTNKCFKPVRHSFNIFEIFFKRENKVVRIETIFSF